MKKTTIAAAMAAMLALSGLTGFGGAYLANEWHGKSGGQNVGQTAGQSAVQTAMNAGTSDLSLDKVSTPPSNSVTKLAVSESDTLPLSIPEIAKMNGDSVVEITTEVVTTGGRLRQFVSEGAGSGVVVRSNGYIATNFHVIDGARKITVRLKNGTTYDAKVIGRDTKTDMAVLKIDAGNLQPALFGDSGKLKVGEPAVAIGNPLGELGGTVTEGIISALDRSIVMDGETMTLLQTSAAINPGNSGGGLFNQYGELIGIVNAKSSGSDIEGIGFAIPINTAKPVIEQIIQYGYVKGRVDLGISLVDITSSLNARYYGVFNPGVYVMNVAKNNGFRSGDRIVSINGKEVNSSSEVNTVLGTLTAGQSASFKVERNGQLLTLNIKLEQDQGM